MSVDAAFGVRRLVLLEIHGAALRGCHGSPLYIRWGAFGCAHMDFWIACNCPKATFALVWFLKFSDTDWLFLVFYLTVSVAIIHNCEIDGRLWAPNVPMSWNLDLGKHLIFCPSDYKSRLFIRQTRLILTILDAGINSFCQLVDFPKLARVLVETMLF